ncbi:MAG: hypothetical protein ACU836_12205 [Gammaproteobacteria bacterium]
MHKRIYIRTNHTGMKISVPDWRNPRGPEGLADSIDANHLAVHPALTGPPPRLALRDLLGNSGRLYLGIEYQY